MASLKGKVALITGGSQGIGRAAASLLAAQGCSIAINYASNAAAADLAVSELGRDKTIAIKGDAGSITDVDTVVKETVGRFGKIDILVSCAATLPMKELADTTEDLFDRSMAVNVKGPFFLVQRAAPHMGPGSHVVLMSTTQCHASTVTPPYALYTMTKGAIEQMTRVLAKDLGRKQIMVNCVAPGPTSTSMFLTGKSPELLKTISTWSPHGRIGQPEEAAEAIVFLSQAGWVSGQVLRVNGAMA